MLKLSASNAIKARLPLTLLLASTATLLARSQTTTNTYCNGNGTSLNCQSTTTSNTAQQQQMYQAGQQVGDALGTGIAMAMNSGRKRHWVRHYCAGHPGSHWNWNVAGRVVDSGECPTVSESSVIAANEFMAKHKDYVPEQGNAETMLAYISEHNLDPREEKTYERGFKELKKEDKLHLYSK